MLRLAGTLDIHKNFWRVRNILVACKGHLIIFTEHQESPVMVVFGNIKLAQRANSISTRLTIATRAAFQE